MSALPRQTRLTDPLINGGKMTDLNEMWARIEAHQSHADRRGFGAEWRRMCQERTSIAAETAIRAAVKAAQYAKTFAALKATLAAANVAQTVAELAYLDEQESKLLAQTEEK
jgi:hypothetical protein